MSITSFSTFQIDLTKCKELIDFKQPVFKNNKAFSQPRNWQKNAVRDLRGQKNSIVIAPTGSGKSLTIMMLIYDKLTTSTKTKAIIIVPQKSIGSGYKNQCFMYNKKEVEINISDRNFKIDTLNNITEVERFLSEKVHPKKIEDRILVCTHSSFVACFNNLSEEKRSTLYKNTMLWIDESHHVRTGSEENNRLSDMFHWYLDNKSHVNLVTATFYRGDGQGFIAEEHQGKFAEFKHTYEAYLSEDCQFLNGLNYNTILWERSPFEIVEHVISTDMKNNKDIKPTIFYLPNINSNTFEDMPKTEQVSKCIDIIKKYKPNAVIIDLVDDSGNNQRNGIRLIQEQNKIAKANNGQKPNIDVIIALEMFKEGADYVPLERVVILGKRESLTQIMQCTGRALRDYRSKNLVEVYHALPGYYKGVQLRNILNENLKTVYYDMLMEEIVMPVPRDVTLDKEVTAAFKSTLWEDYFHEESAKVKNDILYTVALKLSDPMPISEEEKVKVVEDLKERGITDEKVITKIIENKNQNDMWKILVKEELKERKITDEKVIQKMVTSLHTRVNYNNLRYDNSRKWEHISIDLLESISPIANILKFVDKGFKIKNLTELKRSLQSSISFPEWDAAWPLSSTGCIRHGIEAYGDYVEFVHNLQEKYPN